MDAHFYPMKARPNPRAKGANWEHTQKSFEKNMPLTIGDQPKSEHLFLGNKLKKFQTVLQLKPWMGTGITMNSSTSWLEKRGVWTSHGVVTE